MFPLLKPLNHSHKVSQHFIRLQNVENYAYSKIWSRTSSGKLHLVNEIGKIPLADALLIEDPSETSEDDGNFTTTHNNNVLTFLPMYFRIIDLLSFEPFLQRQRSFRRKLQFAKPRLQDNSRDKKWEPAESGRQIDLKMLMKYVHKRFFPSALRAFISSHAPRKSSLGFRH